MSTAQDSTVVTGYPAGAYQVDTGYPYPPSHSRSNYDQPTRQTPHNNPQPTESPKPRLGYLFAMGFSVAVSIFLIVFFAMTPSLRNSYPEFKVESATVSQLNATASELTATWDITLLVTNPEHRYRLSFKTLQAWLLYRGHRRPMLATTPLRPFVLSKRNQTRLDMKLAAVSQWVGDDVGKEIYDDRSRGFMSFRVKVRACYRYDLFFEVRECYVVNCDQVHFGFSRNETGKLIEQKECELLRDRKSNY